MRVQVGLSSHDTAKFKFLGSNPESFLIVGLSGQNRYTQSRCIPTVGDLGGRVGILSM